MDAPDADVRELRRAMESVDATVLAHRLREVATVDVSREFASSSVPTLYLGGKRDRLVGARVIEHLRGLRPDMQSCVLDAPHLVLQREPVEAARVISRFLLPHLVG